MTQKALVLLPERPASLLHTDTLNPLDHLAGMTLLQRTLCNLQWAGIREGVLLSHDTWPEAERAVREDKKNRAFTWITLSQIETGSPEEARLERLLSDSVLVQFPGWIVDRNTIRELLSEAKPGTRPAEKGIVLEPAGRPESGPDALPPLALLPAAQAPELARTLLRKAPIREIQEQVRALGDPEVRTVGEPLLIRVARPEDRNRAERLLLRGLIKPTESWLSKNFERRVSLALTRRLLHTRVTPNQISVFSILLGLAAALLFLPENRPLHVAGAVLLLLSSIVDGCDGELARLRYQESRLGSWLDFLGDNVVHMAVFFCIGYGLYLRGEGPVYLVLGITAALASGAAASSVFFRVILKSRQSVITFATPVRMEEMEGASGRLRKQIDFTDRISNRDFIYAILVLSIAGHLWIFAWLSGLGSVFYLGALLYLYGRMGILWGGRGKASAQ